MGKKIDDVESNYWGNRDRPGICISLWRMQKQTADLIARVYGKPLSSWSMPQEISSRSYDKVWSVRDGSLADL